MYTAEIGNPELLTIDEVRARLRCSRRKVFLLLAAGRLRRVRFGKQTHVGAESVDALLRPAAPRRAAR